MFVNVGNHVSKCSSNSLCINYMFPCGTVRCNKIDNEAFKIFTIISSEKVSTSIDTRSLPNHYHVMERFCNQNINNVTNQFCVKEYQYALYLTF